MHQIALTAHQLVKRYGGVVALADGSLEVRSGEVVALVGANGSGKSTLGKIITGAVAPDGGQLILDGRAVHFPSPQAARRAGIAAVYQDLSLVPDLTVAENIWLAHEPIGWGWRVRRGAMREATARLLDLFAGTVRSTLTPETPVAALPPDERQIVEILKALSLNPRLMILDEATASLDSNQVARLFELVARWKAEGMAVIFVSHRMEEIFRLADRAVVLRSGQTVGTRDLRTTSEQELVALMIEGGLAVESRSAAGATRGAERLRVAGLRAGAVRGVDLSLHDGEIVGLGGLRGQGQTDLLLALFGALPFTGEVRLAGQPVRFTHPSQAMEAGIAFVPGDRTREGLLPIRSILENLLLPSWHRYGALLRLTQARRDAQAMAQRLNLVMESLDAPVSSLSGGNAQKVVLGKWLLREPRLLLLDDPTKGVDVGAKREFYQSLEELRDAGVAILLYSSDDEELLGLCDRVLVLRDGQVRAELAGPTLTRAELVSASIGALMGETS
ncbi:MAG: sugar ABC transporter ATP-binding protein [Sphaerobacter sp.]|nr:sugar ABC transporter ATP-binding protein [Sphaerobacter sp.]